MLIFQKIDCTNCSYSYLCNLQSSCTLFIGRLSFSELSFQFAKILGGFCFKILDQDEFLAPAAVHIGEEAGLCSRILLRRRVMHIVEKVASFRRASTVGQSVSLVTGIVLSRTVGKAKYPSLSFRLRRIWIPQRRFIKQVIAR